MAMDILKKSNFALRVWPIVGSCPLFFGRRQGEKLLNRKAEHVWLCLAAFFDSAVSGSSKTRPFGDVLV
jgi:hypothetical protein